MILVLAIGAGGALGAIARFLVSLGVQRLSRTRFPLATLLVNISGSFLIGIVFALADSGRVSGETLTFLVSGLLGGYTTFSTFSVENLKLLEEGRTGAFALNITGQIASGVALAAAGYWLAAAVV